VLTVRQHRLLLLGGRQQSEPRHIRTVTTATDIPDWGRPTSLWIGFLAAPKSTVSSRRTLR